MFTAVSLLKCQAGKEARFEELLREAARRSREEPGNRRYQVFRSVEEPSTFLAYHEYVDREAFDAHMASPAFWEVFSFAKELFDGTPPPNFYQPV